MAAGRTRRETSAGGVVVRCAADGPRVLLIHDGHRNWGFPKGPLDAGETPEAAALREISEETGLTDLALGGPLGRIDWWFRWEGRTVHKFCHFFLVHAPTGVAEPQADEGIRACRWCTLAEAHALLTHDNARTILAAAAPLAAALCAAGEA